jgi:L-methionine (R)-S-oxide reductase
MSEGILLPALPRATLLAPDARVARLREAAPQIEAAVAAESDEIVVEATLACLLFQTMAQTNWCGFYRRTAQRALSVGPYQGTMGCRHIAFERGVCGACAREQRTILVPDVHAHPDHIACDDASRSELVIPVVADGELRAVLDLDSPHPDGFCQDEAALLEALLGHAFRAVRWHPLPR